MTENGDNTRALEFAHLTAVSMVPFAAGVLAAPFDRQGMLLKYYPFRFGDVMIALAACLLAAYVVQRWATTFHPRAWLSFTAATFLALVTVFARETRAFARHTDRAVNATSGDPWEDACRAVRQRTPLEAVILTAPVEGSDFTGRTRRATVVKFKLFPQSPEGIIEWYRRLRDLCPGLDPAALARADGYEAQALCDAVERGFAGMTTDEVVGVMDRYGADFALTAATQKLRLPVLFRNGSFVLYARART